MISHMPRAIARCATALSTNVGHYAWLQHLCIVGPECFLHSESVELLVADRPGTLATCRERRCVSWAVSLAFGPFTSTLKHYR
jgi:hypothetical protein